MFPLITAEIATYAAHAIGWNDGVGTKYWQIEFDTRGYENIKLFSKQRSSATGPKDFKLQLRIGSDASWVDISGGEITVGNEYVSGVVEDLQLPEGVDDTSSVFVRWMVTSTISVGGGEVGSVGTSYIDDIVVTGVEISTVGIVDTDGDTIFDENDNCPAVANTDQFDNESDGIGDVCDPDDDNDGIEDATDNCQYVTNIDQADMDGDTVGDECDLDKDGDGVENTSDNCPVTANADQLNSDGVGLGDECENNPSDEVLVDEVQAGSLSGWEVYDYYNNPIFYFEEIVSPYDGSTAIKTRAVGNTTSYCSTEYLKKSYGIRGNTDTTKLKAYLEFYSNLTTYNFPYIYVQLHGGQDDELLGYQIYYGKGMVGSYYIGMITSDPLHFTELPSATGDMLLDLSKIGENIDFGKVTISITNYTCVGENSTVFDHLRVIDGEFNGGAEEDLDEEPSKISTCKEFQAMNNNLDWHYELVNDIDCLETESWNSGKGFFPISAFTGVLDGQNFTVNNLFMNVTDSSNSSTWDHGGVFDTNSGTIKNINFRDVNISADGYMGGLINTNAGIIEKVSMTGTVHCGYQQCGVLVGTNSGTISQSWTDADITGPNYIGGIVGHSYGGKIENSYVKGTINGNSDTGGIVGLNQNTLVSKSYSNGVGGMTGGVIGWQYDGGNQSGSYWNAELSGLENMCGINGTNCLDENGLTDVQMKDQVSFVDWDFENVWAIDPEKNDRYPYLQWQTSFSEQGGDEPEDIEDEEEQPLPPTNDVVRRSGGGSLMKTTAVQKPSSRNEEDATETPSTETEEGSDDEDESPAGNVRGAQTSQFLSDLSQGMESEDVRALQEYLRSLGFFTFPTSTGYFGPMTLQAVQAFQRHHSLPETGYVGPLTREKLHLGMPQGVKKPVVLALLKW